MADLNHAESVSGKKSIVIALAVSVILFAVLLWYTGYIDDGEAGRELLKDLCDSCSTVGVMYMCAGILVLSAKNGTFNFFTYNSGIFRAVIAPSTRTKKRKPYFEYISEKEEQHKKWRVWYIFAIGGVYCFLGGVFLYMYYNVPV